MKGLEIKIPQFWNLVRPLFLIVYGPKAHLYPWGAARFPKAAQRPGNLVSEITEEVSTLNAEVLEEDLSSTTKVISEVTKESSASNEEVLKEDSPSASEKICLPQPR